MRIAVVDDDRVEVQKMKDYVTGFCKDRDIPVSVSCFYDGRELMEDYGAQYDALFLDIEMKEMDGMATARKIRHRDPDTPIIFVTQMAQYALEGYRVDALDFLVKPVSYADFEMTFLKLMRYLSKKPDRSVVLHVTGQKRIIPVADICYAEVLAHYVTYRTRQGEVRVRQTLSEAERTLAGFPFIKCNRYCLANITYITDVYHDGVEVEGHFVSVSRSKRKEILLAVAQYMGGEM